MGDKLWVLINRGLLIGAFALASYTVKLANDNKIDIVRLQGDVKSIDNSRYKPDDALRDFSGHTAAENLKFNTMQQTINQHMLNTQKALNDLATLVARLPTKDDVPPDWFEAKVNSNEARIMELERKSNGL